MNAFEVGAVERLRQPEAPAPGARPAHDRPALDPARENEVELLADLQMAVVDEARLEEEMGDLLFATVNLSRHLGVKAETALQKANLKFERRFREVERIVVSRGLEMTGVDLNLMEEVWQEVKRQEHDL